MPSWSLQFKTTFLLQKGGCKSIFRNIIIAAPSNISTLLQVSIDFAPGKDYSDLNIGSEARRLSTLDKVFSLSLFSSFKAQYLCMELDNTLETSCRCWRSFPQPRSTLTSKTRRRRLLREWKRLLKPMELKTGSLFMQVRIGDIFAALTFQMRLGQFQSVDNRKMSQGQSLCWPSFLYA